MPPDYCRYVAIGSDMIVLSIFTGQDSAVNCVPNCFRDRHSALIEGSVGMAPMCQPCTRSGSGLAMAFKFAKDLPRDASVITIGTIVCHFCDEELALAAGFCDIHHSCRNIVSRAASHGRHSCE